MDEQGRRLLYGSDGRGRLRPCNFRPRNGASSLTIRPSCVISIFLCVSERPLRSLQKALSFCAHRGHSIESLGVLISARQRGGHLNLESNDESILCEVKNPYPPRPAFSLRATARWISDALIAPRNNTLVCKTLTLKTQMRRVSLQNAAAAALSSCVHMRAGYISHT